jgi:hypothetical protein
MQTIDESRLETDLQYRYEYLAEFTGFTAADATLIQSFAPHLGPQIGALVEETYDKLLQYDECIVTACFSGWMPLVLAREKGVRYRKCKAPLGPFRFSVPDPFFGNPCGQPELLPVTKH